MYQKMAPIRKDLPKMLLNDQKDNHTYSTQICSNQNHLLKNTKKGIRVLPQLLVAQNNKMKQRNDKQQKLWSV